MKSQNIFAAIITIVIVTIMLYLAFAFVLWDIAWVPSSCFYTRLIFAILNAGYCAAVIDKK